MLTRINTKILVLISLVLVFFSVLPVEAEDFTSSNFILRDPVITIAGDQSSSANFQYFSSSGQTAPGESISSNFTYRAGFLYFPTATSPAVSATGGNGQVSLTWTAAVGSLANVTNYQVGTATVSGGPFTFESVGNVLSFVKTGLANGVTYYFKIKADAGTLTLSQSDQVSATTTGAGATPTPSPGPGGGGGGGINPTITTVNFLGHAYPLSKVTVLKDGQIAITTIAGPDANFSVSLTGLLTGNYIFSLYGEDSKGRRSTLFNFPLYITEGATTTISGIFITPTIDVDKTEVKRGDNIAIFGQSVPKAEITIATNSDQEFFNKVTSQDDGSYLYNFDTTPLELGQHTTKSKAALALPSNEVSPFSRLVGFVVGTQTVIKPVTKCGRADLNCDGRVNLVDFSIAAYWYKRPLSNAFLQTEKERLNGDGVINLTDFSIMAYYWTG